MPLNESNRRWAGSRTGRRLAACLLAISAVVILAGAAVQVYLEYRHDREEIDVTLRQAHGSLESLITQSLWLTNDDMLANTVRGLLSLPYITEVTVDKRDGTRLSEMRAAARQPLVHAHDIIKIYRDRPVPLGHITVTADLAIVFSNLFKQARLRIAIQATLAITLAAAAMILFHRQIGRHLSRMSNYSQSLTIDTLDAPLVLEKRIPADSRADDIDRLALAINDMREKLRGSLDSLQQSEERFDLAMQFANDGLFDWNLATNEIYYSRGWKKMLGYEPHEIKNEFSEWERLTQPDDVADSWNMLREVIDGKRPRFEMEFRMRHKDGHWVDVLSRANVLRDDRGKAIRVVGTHVDITERKAMESRLRENQRLESIGTLAGGIAHDFNNLLYPIVGRAEMLMEDFSPGSLEHECAEEIFKAAMRGSELVQQILVISRRTPQKKVAAKLSGIVAEAVKLARSTIPADIDIAVHIEDRDGMVLAAPSQLHQVVMNLITNAYHALETDGGTITVGLQQADDAETMVAGDSRDARPHLKLTVADTGCGIDRRRWIKFTNPTSPPRRQAREPDSDWPWCSES